MQKEDEKNDRTISIEDWRTNSMDKSYCLREEMTETTGFADCLFFFCFYSIHNAIAVADIIIVTGIGIISVFFWYGSIFLFPLKFLSNSLSRTFRVIHKLKTIQIY